MSCKIKLFTNFFWNRNSVGKTGLLNKHWPKQTFSAQINYGKKIIELIIKRLWNEFLM